ASHSFLRRKASDRADPARSGTEGRPYRNQSTGSRRIVSSMDPRRKIAAARAESITSGGARRIAVTSGSSLVTAEAYALGAIRSSSHATIPSHHGDGSHRPRAVTHPAG